MTNFEYRLDRLLSRARRSTLQRLLVAIGDHRFNSQKQILRYIHAFIITDHHHD